MKQWHIVALALLIPLLWFAYYALSPLFIKVTLNEPLPEDIKDTSEQVLTSPAGSITGTIGHPASGSVRIIEADGRTYVRYENYKTINGPDLFVYLSKDLDAREFVSLGAIRGTEGNINYAVPEGVTVADYPYVLTWCRAFGVLFNYATIN